MCICRPPGQSTLSVLTVLFFKQYLFVKLLFTVCSSAVCCGRVLKCTFISSVRFKHVHCRVTVYSIAHIAKHMGFGQTVKTIIKHIPPEVNAVLSEKSWACQF